MSNIPRDQNSVTVLAGLSSIDGTTIVPIAIDAITGRVLIQIVTNTDETTAVIGNAYRDENNVPVKTAITDDANESIANILVDSSNSGVLCDVVFE